MFAWIDVSVNLQSAGKPTKKGTMSSSSSPEERGVQDDRASFQVESLSVALDIGVSLAESGEKPLLFGLFHLAGV
jgi:hypothetical protein